MLDIIETEVIKIVGWNRFIIFKDSDGTQVLLSAEHDGGELLLGGGHWEEGTAVLDGRKCCGNSNKAVSLTLQADAVYSVLLLP